MRRLRYHSPRPIGAALVCSAMLLSVAAAQAAPQLQLDADVRKMSVREAMSPDICFCYEDQSVESAAKLMEEKQIRRLPVFDRSERAIGMVSLGDLAVRNQDDRLSGEVLGRVSKPSQLDA